MFTTAKPLFDILNFEFTIIVITFANIKFRF